MPGGESSRKGTNIMRAHAELEELRTTSAALRELAAQVCQRSASASQEARRVRAESRRVRGELIRVRLPREPTCSALARRLVEEHLTVHSPDELVDVKMVVSELVNNAFMHGDGVIELSLCQRRGRLLVEVRDEGAGIPVRSNGDHASHGLDIVDSLALTWGARSGSTRVWAELAVGSGTRSSGAS